MYLVYIYIYTCLPGESSLCTLYLHACQVRVTELQLVTQVFVVVLASLCTLYLYACQESCHRRLRSLLLCLRVYVPCIYMHARRVAVGAHVFVVVLASLCTLYLHACQERVTVGDSGLGCCACVRSLEC